MWVPRRFDETIEVVLADGTVQAWTEARNIANATDHDQLYVWDAAHAPEIDQPERVLKLVTDFLTQSEAFVVNWGDGQPA